MRASPESGPPVPTPPARPLSELIYAQVVELHPEYASNLELTKQQHQQYFARQAKMAAGGTMG